MSEDVAGPSTFDLGSLFGLNGIGNIGPAFNLLRRSLNGETITADDIPEGMNDQILRMAMQQFGASTLEEFLSEPAVVQQIVDGLRANTLDPNIPNEEKIIVAHIATLGEEELQTILTSNPQLIEIIASDLEAESFRPMIEARVDAELENLTVRDALTRQGLSTEELGNFPAAFLDTPFNELEASDIIGVETDNRDRTSIEGGFSNEQLTSLVGLLPADQFNEVVLARMNENLPADQQLSAAADSTYSDRVALFEQGLEALQANTLTSNNTFLSGAWWAAAVTSEEDVENAVFNGIREAIPGALEDLRGNFDREALIEQAIAEFDPSTIDFENIDIASVLPQGQLQQLVADNLDQIGTALTREENWEMIQAMLLADNGRMIRANQDRIIEHMIPVITEQGLSSFNNLMGQLPPEFRELIVGFLEMFGGFLQQFGIDIGPVAGTNTPGPQTGPQDNVVPAPGE